MKTIGIVCEYNPFHNGHKYHIEKAKQLTGADYVVCVMSGNFMQRGDVAVFDKHTRTKAALLSGADLVFELPVVYSLSCAEKFAKGAVSLLDAAGVDFLCFGAECSKLSTLENLADILLNETPDYKACLSKNLNAGMSFQTSRDKAINEVYNISAAPLSKPNNALAIEYLKAIKSTNSKMKPILIKRRGAGYNSDVLDSGEFASATGVRKALKNQGLSSVSEFIPDETLCLYEDKKAVFLNELDEIVLYRLRSMDKEELKNINDANEGIENRIIEGAKKCSSISELVSFVSGKRYTKNRISRIILSALLKIKTTDVKEPEYLRVLGMTKNGAKVLASLKKTCPLPVITKLSKFEGSKAMLNFDILASDVYSLFCQNKEGMSDFKISPAVIDKDEVNYVYIIKCADNSLYCGWTNNLEKRFEDHKRGKGAKYTKGRGPLELVYYEVIKDKSTALKREYEIKQLSRSQKDELIKGFNLADSVKKSKRLHI